MKAYATRIATAGLLVASLGVLGGCAAVDQNATDDTAASSTATTTDKAYADSEAAFEVNAAFAQQDGSYTSPNGIQITKHGKNYVVSKDDAKKIFSATVEGKQINFPCTAQDVLDQGWAYSDSNIWKEAHMEDERIFRPGFGEHMIYLKDTSQQADEYDRTAKEIRIHVNNTNDVDTPWKECTCVGAAFQAFQDDIDNGLDGKASFQTGIGINVGDNAQEVIDTFGTWKYYDENIDRQSDKLRICVDDNGEEVPVGYLNFEQNDDGIITLVNIKVNPNHIDLLS